ncbi:hypothetical protein B0T14DRAFT_499015 [Immersiella caudata]|uniref:Uncharacterized protein n=1 Tax=Immersiella caudata TaxID=314043 RepID=A0AA39WDT7_9PEZI|nr:hypothetical protein B0T14DRAFT_499015 [Immersiella caudata]
MPSNSGAPYDVHVGAWTDWSRGKVLGATLTLTRQDSGLLIAFLAFFVALVGTRFWRVVCLLLHWYFSKDSPADGVHHQRQAFLRNSPNPESALWTLARMGIYWRQNATRVWPRVVSLLALALACLVGFILAVGYSSRIATFVTSEVLLSGANCAFVGDAGVNMSNYGRTIGPMIAQDMIAAESYARQCYSSTSAPSCSTFYVRRQLPTALLDTNASCPFGSKLCKSTSGNLFLNTGFLDSYLDFGRQRDVNGTASVNYTTRYPTGNEVEIEDLTLNFIPDTERDFAIRSHAALSYKKAPYAAMSTFVPIPELSPKNDSGTVWILFLKSDNILFSEDTKDDWYGRDLEPTEVHKLKGWKEWGNVTMFRQHQPGSPLACQEMDQFCFTDVKGVRKCSRLGSPADAMLDLRAMMDEGDQEWNSWFVVTTFETMTQVRDPVELLGTRALRARDSLNGPILGPLPDNQWQLEVQHWHSTSAAQLQQTFLRTIIGPTNPELPNLIEVWRPNTTVERDICANQIQRLAHEATGAGTWSRATGSIPVTKPGDLLAVLDIADPEHPRLRAPMTDVDHGLEEDDTSDTANPGGADEKNMGEM